MLKQTWFTCKCGAYNIATYGSSLNFQCDECNSSLLPVLSNNTSFKKVIKKKDKSLREVVSSLDHSLFEQQKPKMLGRYVPQKEVQLALSI